MSEKLATSFVFCPKCGQKNNSGANPFQCSANECEFTLYFSPITAVAGIVTDSEGRVLFLKRAKEPGKGKLGLPGGFVDPGESLEEALVREVLEETNLKATSIEYMSSFPNVYVYKGIALDVTDMFFRCEVESFEPLAAQKGEVSSFHLAKPTTELLENMAFDSNRNALKQFLKR